MNIAIFGGSFSPPHWGHAHVLKHLGELKNPDRSYRFDRIWVIPTHLHAFGKVLLPFETRLALCRLLIEALPCRQDCYAVLDIEREFPAESRTVDTLRTLRHRFPADTFTLVLGSDLKSEISTWKDADEIPQLAQLYFFPRIAGYASREVKARMDAHEDFRDLVPPLVYGYLTKKG